MRAIDGDALIDKYGDWYTEEGTEEGYIGTIKGIVDSMPTIEPKRKTGKWVGYDGDWLKTMCKCSECGAMIDINEKYRNFFCYHCGTDMRGEHDE